MNFGEILEKWEQGRGSSQNDVMQTWLNENKIYDKDAGGQKEMKTGENRRRLLRIRPDDIIDIHGATREKAFLLLDQFFVNAKNSGYEKLRIIHGKGNNSQGEAVLNRAVREFIERCPYAGESGPEKSPNGGTGATWVFLKN